MALASNKNKHLVPIQQCKNFTNDPVFSDTRDLLKKQGSSIVQEILRSDQCAFETSMEQAYFHDDRFEVVVDTRGYAPQDIQCAVMQENIEITASIVQKEGNIERKTTMTRSYQLPKLIIPERGICNLSSEGILVVSAPWKN